MATSTSGIILPSLPTRRTCSMLLQHCMFHPTSTCPIIPPTLQLLLGNAAEIFVACNYHPTVWVSTNQISLDVNLHGWMWIAHIYKSTPQFVQLTMHSLRAGTRARGGRIGRVALRTPFDVQHVFRPFPISSDARLSCEPSSASRLPSKRWCTEIDQ